MNKKNVLLAGLLGTLSLGAESATFMDASWASQLCQAWNKNPNLTGKLGGDAWAANNAGRGYKTIQLYRDECGLGSKVELQISDKDGKAICTRGGAVEEQEPGLQGRLPDARQRQELGLHGRRLLRLRRHGRDDHRQAQIQRPQG